MKRGEWQEVDEKLFSVSLGFFSATLTLRVEFELKKNQ